MAVMFYDAGYWPYLKYLIALIKLAIGQQSSLFCPSISDTEIFIIFAPVACAIKVL